MWRPSVEPDHWFLGTLTKIWVLGKGRVKVLGLGLGVVASSFPLPCSSPSNFGHLKCLSDNYFQKWLCANFLFTWLYSLWDWNCAKWIWDKMWWTETLQQSHILSCTRTLSPYRRIFSSPSPKVHQNESYTKPCLLSSQMNNGCLFLKAKFYLYSKLGPSRGLFWEFGSRAQPCVGRTFPALTSVDVGPGFNFSESKNRQLWVFEKLIIKEPPVSVISNNSRTHHHN